MTQLELYAQMMKVSFTEAKARIAYSVGVEGSVLSNRAGLKTGVDD